jgi:sulfur relay (sulfurtransferase) complex TusBCD TusD component (DsrE family)
MRFTSVFSGAALLGLAAAHPGHDISHEMAERRDFLKASKRVDLAHCASKLKSRGVEQRNIARRSAMAKALSKKSRPTRSTAQHASRQ